MKVIGLTGSIGMGKSTVLAMFADAGCATWDADAAVHRLYAPGGAATQPVEALFPGVMTDQGGIDRAELSARLKAEPDGFGQLEAVVHPLVRADREHWLAQAERAGAAMAVVDIPLLFETGGDSEVDVVVVVSAPAAEQRRRVLARPGMTEDRFEQILARQIPDAAKRAGADFVIDTGGTLQAARDQVHQVLETLSTPEWRSVRAVTLHSRGEPGE